MGHIGDARSVGDGVFEMRIRCGPGYRLYFMHEGETVVVLLCSGDEDSQERDIARAKRPAKERWIMAETFTKWDVTDHLRTKEDACFYLEAATEEDPGDGSLIRAVLNDIARAQNISRLALDIGIIRKGLYKALSEDGNLSFATVMRITRALGMQLRITV